MASNPPREEPVGEHFKNGQRRHRDHETESNTKQKFIRPGDLSQAWTHSNQRNFHVQGSVGQSKNLPTTGNSTEVRQHVFSTEQNIQRYQPDASHDQGRARMNVASPFSLPDPAGLDRDLSLSNIPDRIEQKKILARRTLTNIANETGFEDKVVERILDSFEKEQTTFFANHLI